MRVSSLTCVRSKINSVCCSFPLELVVPSSTHRFVLCGDKSLFHSKAMKCANFTNPIGYVEMYLLFCATIAVWKAVEIFVNRKYWFLPKERRKKIHDAYADGAYRLLALIGFHALTTRHITTQLFFDFEHTACWEWHLFCAIASMICMHSVLQVWQIGTPKSAALFISLMTSCCQ